MGDDLGGLITTFKFQDWFEDFCEHTIVWCKDKATRGYNKKLSEKLVRKAVNELLVSKSWVNRNSDEIVIVDGILKFKNLKNSRKIQELGDQACKTPSQYCTA